MYPETVTDVIDLVRAKKSSVLPLANRYEIKVGEVLNLVLVSGRVSFKRLSDVKFERLTQ